MARTIAQIKQSILDAVTASPVLGTGGTNPLTSTSTDAIYINQAEAEAIAQQQLEANFDNHVAEVNTIIANQKPGNTPWYAYMAEQFQYGDTLPPDSDVYDPVAPAGDASLIVTFAGASEINGGIRVKVATGTAGSYNALTSTQLAALNAYMSRVKYAGIPVNCTSQAADNLQLGLVLYYDPLILDATGKRLDGTNDTPVVTAINNFLSSLPFDGQFVLTALIAAITAIDGIDSVAVNVCQANYAETEYVTITAYYQPDGGYMALDPVYFSANVSYQPAP